MSRMDSSALDSALKGLNGLVDCLTRAVAELIAVGRISI